MNFGLDSKGCLGDTARGCGRFGSGTFGDQQEGLVEPSRPHGVLGGVAGAAHMALCWGKQRRSPSRRSLAL